MTKINGIGLLCLLTSVMMLLPPMASANTPCGFFEFSWLEPVAEGTTGVALLVLPDGSGPPLTEARGPDGARVDASLVVYLLSNCDAQPVVGIPAEDMWLEAVDHGLVLCANVGAIADTDTDASGRTTWSSALQGGGSSAAGLRIVVSGDVVPFDPIPIAINSPDMNGDRSVNLSDTIPFATAFYGPYDLAADFHYDGRVNLSDVVIMAASLGVSCP